MAVVITIKRGVLSSLPSLANAEPGYVTDQPRLYVGNTGLGNTLLSCLKKIDGTAAPTVNEDAGDGYSVGSIWTDTTNDKSYICSDSTVGAAVWQQISGDGSIGITQLTGDVTAGPGSGSQAATIANSAVTLAKIANIADQTILGNNTGGAAAPVALTATQVRTILGGGILVADGDKGDITVSSSGTAWTIDNGVVTEAKQVLADNTTCNVSITAHGYVPKAPNDATKFLDGTGAWDTVKDSDLSLSDITTNNSTSIRHGFCPKLSNIAANRLDGTGAWSTVTDAQLSVSDVTSNNASTSAHGFLKKLDNDATHYMDGQGNWSVVPAASDSASGIIEVAIQSEQETATSTTLAVTPGRQQYHPSAVKAWGNFDASSGTPTTGASYNVASLTDGGSGLTTVNFTTAFSSANYGGSACCSVSTAAGGFALIGYSVAPAAASCKITTLNGAFGFADCATVVYTFSGDQ